jgi:phage N-6-adenine-methyltransferase
MVNSSNNPPNKPKKREWYTPQPIISLVKQVFNGTIELDPASDTIGQSRVQAVKYYDPQINGLAQAWNADTIFLNPPYARNIIDKWIDKALKEFIKGNYQKGIILTRTDNSTKWFQDIGAKSSMMCLKQGRIKFLNAQGHPESGSTLSNVFFYLDQNQNTQQFHSVFKNIGLIVEPK